LFSAELGDYDPEEHVGNYISEFKLMLNQSEKLETAVMEIHQNEMMRGQTPAQAELNFLRKGSLLETYGVDPCSVKDHKGNQLYLGINFSGIIAFQGSRKTHHFKWNEVQKITYEGRMFIVHLLVNDKKHLIGFKCPTIAACHYLWRCAVEQRYFFTMHSSKEVPFITTGGGLFSRSCKLRYSGRVEREVIEEMRNINKRDAQIRRSYSITSAPPSTRCLGRSNTAPLPNQESPDRSTASYHDKDWDMSMTSSLPTEFDLRPDLTPTGEEAQLIAFETPVVRSSPSHNPSALGDSDTDIMNDEGMDHMHENHNHLKKSNSQSKYTNNGGYYNLSRKPRNKFFVIIRTSILSSLLLLLFFSCLVILIIESESDLFSHLRKLPEMVILRRDYYEPVKDTIWQTIGK